MKCQTATTTKTTTTATVTWPSFTATTTTAAVAITTTTTTAAATAAAATTHGCCCVYLCAVWLDSTGTGPGSNAAPDCSWLASGGDRAELLPDSNIELLLLVLVVVAAAYVSSWQQGAGCKSSPVEQQRNKLVATIDSYRHKFWHQMQKCRQRRHKWTNCPRLSPPPWTSLVPWLANWNVFPAAKLSLLPSLPPFYSLQLHLPLLFLSLCRIIAILAVSFFANPLNVCAVTQQMSHIHKACKHWLPRPLPTASIHHPSAASDED